MNTPPLPFPVSSADLRAVLAGQPIVAVQDDQIQIVEHWTPPGLPAEARSYIGQHKGRYVLYERTSGLTFPTVRVSYPDSYTDSRGQLVSGQAQDVSTGDKTGFASVAALKQFYEVVNPAFEAANPDCLLLRTLLERLLEPGGTEVVVKAYQDKARGWRDEQGRRVW